VEIGIIDFQGLWEGREKQFHRFPVLSMDRRFHACFGRDHTQAAAFAARAFFHSFSNSIGLA
jgi:hypothetical protein